MLPIRQTLMGLPNTDLSQVKRVPRTSKAWPKARHGSTRTCREQSASKAPPSFSAWVAAHAWSDDSPSRPDNPKVRSGPMSPDTPMARIVWYIESSQRGVPSATVTLRTEPAARNEPNKSDAARAEVLPAFQARGAAARPEIWCSIHYIDVENNNHYYSLGYETDRGLTYSGKLR